MIEDMIRLEVTKRGGKTARPGAIALAVAVIRGDEHVRRLTYPSQRQLYGLDPHDYSFKRDWIDDKECGRIRWMINVYYAADAASQATLRFPNPSAARQRAEKKKRAPSHSELLLPRLLPAAAPLPPPYCRSVSHDAGPSDTEREHSTPNPAGPIKRRQLPAQHAWSFTINKSQGRTIPRSIVDVRRPFWQHGSGHVAFSRVPCSKDSAAFADSESVIYTGGRPVPVIRNVVYPGLVVG
jgi:hypothetical protein